MRKTPVRITTFIPEVRATKFAELTREIGVSGTALLGRTLPAELDYLARVPANTRDIPRAVVRFFGPDEPRRRLNITLAREDAARMNELCREKRIDRDSFINAYIMFLVEGGPGVCEAPLELIAKILRNPRLEYERVRNSSPTEDEMLLNDRTGSIVLNPKFPEENPYDFLHHDELVARVERAIKEGKELK